ncbi:hypothetical protein CHGG_05205 [Chaetomium globosum CBS 148.51]|uniref:NAD-dependent epimerase/dehydratase domain-containing protein n=1 Tax=Chaetomium globosum (strain ATCC 6205 / CBS 148.51 / DSM 1962 / NBRC 6347 / NRRL 1970) TaxID=306901 RepID=Q2GZ41_CHAGB|nr:uncharacterized protein CHGG_05205 [Chaetomium globosum CBS 148.51]EAQ88586.1 hypothetical protein CHGG_05205 [Chaetomium globosum CBS 148.51]
MSTNDTQPPSKGKVLLTGGTGFIASHVLDCLLDHGFDVVVTVVVSSPPIDYVVHTASPYRMRWEDPKKECLDPAINGISGLLNSLYRYAPGVKRVVFTSSSAAMLDPPNHPKVYDESCWCKVTSQEAMDPANTYRASKTFAERYAWDFYKRHPDKFTLATINCTYTFGPLPRSLDSLDNLNTSNHRIRNLVQGRMREGMPPTAPVFTFVDVRDVALAHVRAMTVPDAAEKRFYVVGGFFSNYLIASIVRCRFPQLETLLPPAENVKDDFPEEHWAFDNSRSKEVLGLEYTGLEKTVVDTVESILAFNGAGGKSTGRS